MRIFTKPWRGGKKTIALYMKSCYGSMGPGNSWSSYLESNFHFFLFARQNDHFFQFNSLLIAEAAQYVQADISGIIAGETQV